MFRTKTNVKNYLDVVRPWAMGKDNRGWEREDFQHPTGAIGGAMPAWIDREDVREARTNLGHVVFPLVPFNVSVLDRLFLPKDILLGILYWNQKVAAFNAVLDAVNATEDKELRWERMILLHVGAIGTTMGPGIYAAFRQLEAEVTR